MKPFLLRGAGLLAGLVFAMIPLVIVLKGSTHQVPGSWYSVAMVFSVTVVAIFAFLLRVEAKDVSKGLAWSLVPFLFVSLMLWAVVHLPAH